MKLKGKHMYVVSRIISKMGIKLPTISVDNSEGLAAAVMLDIAGKVHLAQAELDELSLMLGDTPASEMEIPEFEQFLRDFWAATGFSKFF